MSIKTAECRSCGEPIFFATTRNGKIIPINVVEERMEEWAGQTAPDGRPAFTRDSGMEAHFSTCPYADSYRKGKGA